MQRRGSVRVFLALVLALVLLIFPFVGKKTPTAVSAAERDLIKIGKYDVEMTVLPSRRVEVVEELSVTFLQSDLTMFYHSLPTDGCKYADIRAVCLTENPNFSYDVVDNPDVDGFIDVECIGGVAKGVTHVYQISYVMEQGVASDDGMLVDVVGFGSTVPIHNVTATLHFPTAVRAHTVYEGQTKLSEKEYSLSEDGKTLYYQTDVLELADNESFGERTAKGVTVEFTLQEGTFVGYARSRIFTKHIGKLLLGAFGCIGVALLLRALKKKREIIPIVHIKPPEGMTPLQMGKILDGTADNEDVTSMLYYFAEKGYLKIDLQDEDDPTLIKLVPALPAEAQPHEKTLFEGLFKAVENTESAGCVKVSQLVTRFFESAEKAKAQVPTPKPMYEAKSVFGFVLGSLLGGLYAFFGAFLMGRVVGGGYSYLSGAVLSIPLVVNLFLALISENYRYKWKQGRRWAMGLAELLLAAAFAGLFIGCFAEHLMTGWEKAVLCLGGLVPAFITRSALTRTEKYVTTLGNILGFKDFIVATEEDKIQVMLQENPELYYQVLPYAQVLGVTDEWEKKFEKITLEPPTWYVGGSASLFDYMLLSSCMRRSMARAMVAAAKRAQGGGHIGRSGGGGSFGSFGGGGFGGGGFGAR